MNIVILDGYTMNPGDLDWKALDQFGEVTVYDRTAPQSIVERSKDADIILTNKVVLDALAISQLPKLKFICVTATGYNNVDLSAARERNIPVSNAVGYSTSAVAQHVFALILAFTNRVELHSNSVKRGEWSQQPDFCYTLQTITELKDKALGIYGFGRIGQAVAKLALAFEMKVLVTHKHPERDAMDGVEFVDLESLFQNSDFVSLHAPLSDRNKEIVNKSLLQKMKPTAHLINTGRGGLIQEEDLRDALLEGVLKGAAVDVLSEEPPKPDHPLISVENCLITPHIAWISREARQRLLTITIKNISAFLAGAPQNVVNA